MAFSSTTEPTQRVPNWRTLPVPCDENKDESAQILQQRESWSSQTFDDSLELYDKLSDCTDAYIAPFLLDALKAIDKAYRLYGPESVIVSFNGGKDACVILHLMRASHAHHYRLHPHQPKIRPRALYFDHPDEFPEIKIFVRHTVQKCDLDMIQFREGTKFSQGLEVLVETNTLGGPRPYPMAFVLGTRTSDPNAGKQGTFAPSSSYMPSFMRVNPVLDWSYGLVWHFLRLYQLPYCSLYDQGYTSLGTTKDTLPCPALRVVGGDEGGLPTYWPAYMLRDYDQERAGRVSTSKPKSESPLSRGNSTVTNLSALTAPPAGDDGSVVSYTQDVTQKRVGVLIIGDEILKGFTADTNTQAAAKALRAENVLLEKVVIASDQQQEIVKEIHRLQREVDVIVTSGGVGPTHDDVTIKSVAAALECELALHGEMAELLKDKMNTTSLSEAQIKMATLPSSSKLRYLSDNPMDWPVLQCQNVFILPGVPEFFAKKIASVASYLSCQLQRGTTYKVILSIDENSIVPMLNEVVKRHGNVTLGSYPFVSHPELKTVITVEAKLQPNETRNSQIFDSDAITLQPLANDRVVQLALDDLIKTLPKGSVLRVEDGDETQFT